MTKDKGILIRNVYYMLAYAFQVLRQNNYEDISKENFTRIQDLFAEILYRGISSQIKQGLYKEYIVRHESLTRLKGKLDINATIRNRIQHRQEIACEYDDLSVNNGIAHGAGDLQRVPLHDAEVRVLPRPEAPQPLLHPADPRRFDGDGPEGRLRGFRTDPGGGGIVKIVFHLATSF